MRCLLVLAPLALLAASPAAACLYTQAPEQVGDTSAQFLAGRMAAAASYVDLVLVEDDGTRALDEPATGVITVRSVARLKGAGPDRFSLFGTDLTLRPEAERSFTAPLQHFTREDGRVVPFPYNEERQRQLFPYAGGPHVVKPFDLRELLARVRAVLRRAAQPRPLKTGARPSWGSWSASGAACSVFRHANSSTNTAPKCRSRRWSTTCCVPSQTIRESRSAADRILDLAHDTEMEPFDRSVDSRIVRLRRKIEVDPAAPAVLKTVRGVGYVFRPS